jgi:hypothetical protein
MSGFLTLYVLAINYYLSLGSQSAGVGSITGSHAELSETQPRSLPLRVTGTYLYDFALTITKHFWHVSPQGTQSSPSQGPP